MRSAHAVVASGRPGVPRERRHSIASAKHLPTAPHHASTVRARSARFFAKRCQRRGPRSALKLPQAVTGNPRSLFQFQVGWDNIRACGLDATWSLFHPVRAVGGVSLKTKRLFALVLVLCMVGREAAVSQTIVPPNADPDRLQAIVHAGAQAAGAKAVVFGMWIADREVMTTALGASMTTVPAATDMHYRIGGIAETFMSTLLLMLVEQGRISLDEKISRWFPDLLDADQVTVRMLVANTAGYIDYVTVDDFVKLDVGSAVSHLHRRRIDRLCGSRWQDELPAGYEPAILPHRQRHPGPGHRAGHRAVDRRPCTTRISLAQRA